MKNTTFKIPRIAKDWANKTPENNTPLQDALVLILGVIALILFIFSMQIMEVII